MLAIIDLAPGGASIRAEGENFRRADSLRPRKC